MGKKLVPHSTNSSKVKDSQQYKNVFQTLLGLVGSRREAKKMARMITIGKQVPFSLTEQLFMERHPEYKGNVSNNFYTVKKYTGFRVDEEGEGLVKTHYEPVEEPISFLNIEVNESKITFEKAGNGAQYDEMIQYANDNPQYLERFFDRKIELFCEEEDQVQEARKAKKKEIESKLEAIGETVQLPKMNAVEPEEVPKQHPKKSPRKHPRSYYHTKPADPPVPITE